MFNCLLNHSSILPQNLEENYLEASVNCAQKIARRKVCLEVRRFFSIPFAPLVKMETGEVQLFKSEWKISVSHKEEDAVVALSRYYDSIGIDLEYFHNDVDWTTFHGRFFNREDWILAHQISSKKNLSLDQSFTLLFSAKEAVLKACHLKVDALAIAFSLSPCVFEDYKKIQLFSSLNQGIGSSNFIVEIKLNFNSRSQCLYVLSVCVGNKNMKSINQSLFEDDKLFVRMLVD
ncbi:MAG: 4'-phosphopantetheinyl transferase superfamily protein [Bacteriovoracaceae bacterium]